MGISVVITSDVRKGGGGGGGGATRFTVHALHADEQQTMFTDPRLSIGQFKHGQYCSYALQPTVLYYLFCSVEHAYSFL